MPPEIVLAILKSCNSMSLATLICTTDYFRQVWQENVTSIFYPLLAQTLDCFEEAEYLADIHDMAEHGAQGIKRGQTVSVDRAKRLVANASIVSTLCHLFEEDVLPPIVLNKNIKRLHSAPQLTDKERARFFRAYYRLWTLTVMRSASCCAHLRESLLVTLNNREFYGVVEMSTWLALYCDMTAELQSRGLDGLHEVSSINTLKEMGREWDARKERAGCAPDRMCFPDCAPYYLFAVFDMWQNYMDPSSFAGKSVSKSVWSG